VTKTYHVMNFKYNDSKKEVKICIDPDKKEKNARKGIRTPARFHVAVFETAALPLGYPGI